MKRLLRYSVTAALLLALLFGTLYLTSARFRSLVGTEQLDAVASASVTVDAPSGDYLVLINRDKHTNAENLALWHDFFEGREFSFVFEDIVCSVSSGDPAALTMAQSFQSRLPENQMRIKTEDSLMMLSKADCGRFDVIIMSAESAEALAARTVYEGKSVDVIRVKGETRYHYEVRQDLSVYFSNADDVIASIRRSLKARKGSVTVSYTSHGDNMADIDALVSELMGYALSETDDPACGDYIYYQYGGYDTHYSYTREGDSYLYEIVITPRWYTSRSQEDEVDEKISGILSSLSLDGAEDKEKITRIYDWVCDNVSYDLIHEKNKNYHLKATAYGALVNHTATCQGYAVTLCRLLREAGVEARVVTGTAVTQDGSEEYHAWVRIELDGEYFNADPTWDSVSGGREFFMKPDGEFPRHTASGNE